MDRYVALAAELGNQRFGRAIATEGTVATLARQGSEGTLETSRGIESIEGTRVASGQVDYFGKVKNSLMHASTRLGANSANYGVQVHNACDQFTKHAKTKIGDLEDEITGATLVEALVGVALGRVAGQLTARVTNKALKFAADLAEDVITGKLKEAATSAVDLGDSREGLEQGLDRLVSKTKDASTILTSDAQANFDRRVQPIFRACDERQTWSNADWNALVSVFYDVAPSDLDRQIEESLGIPSASTARVYQVEIFNDLMTAFEANYVSVTATLGQKIDLGLMGDVTLEDVGRRRARTPSGERARSLNLRWTDFARAGRSYEQAWRLGVIHYAFGRHWPTRQRYEQERENAGAE